MKKRMRDVRMKLDGDDFYDDFEIALEDDEITAVEAGFMSGFNES